MSEVIFKGVQFPKTCADCFFWPICPCLADYKDYSEILDAVADGNLVRADGCPISPAKKAWAEVAIATEIAERMGPDVVLDHAKRELTRQLATFIEREFGLIVSEEMQDGRKHFRISVTISVEDRGERGKTNG